VIARDTRTLNRNVLINAAGYGVKLGLPVLLAFGTRAYGAASWGAFVTLQALVMIAVRIAILGLDKAMLWWIPSRGPEGYPALRPVLALVVGSALAVAGALELLGQPLLAVFDQASASQLTSLRIMLIGLPPFAATEVLLNASMGRQRMEPNVIVRDTLQPASLIGFAVLLHAAGVVDVGLAWAFVLSNVLGLAAALVFHRRVFDVTPPPPELARPPRALLRYALPVWAAEFLNTVLLRVNALLVAGFTDPATVGVWSIVMQFGTAMRSIRGAFDSIVTVIAADISRKHDGERLSATLSYAAQLVTLTQLPLFALLLAYADLILPLYGAPFASGSVPLIVICLFWLVHGAAGLAGVVLSGYGKSNLTLINSLVVLLAQVLLLIALVPPLGLAGAAIAVGGSYSLQHIVQLTQLRLLTGSFHFSRRAALPLLPALAGAAVASPVQLLVSSQIENQWFARSLTFSAFLLVYGGLTFRTWRSGRLRAPGAEHSRAKHQGDLPGQ
jgi:O-antigen/teichoic acid export membrane protein